MTHHQGDRSAINALREKIAAAKARAAEIEAEKEALMAKALEDHLQQELDALESQVKSRDIELSLIRKHKDELTVCSSETCESVFIPTKAGQSLCPDCDKRLNPAPIAVIQSPVPSPKKHPVVPALPIKHEEFTSLEPCANEECRKLHRRSPFHLGPRSFCMDCRYKPVQARYHEPAVTKTPPKVSSNPKKIIKKSVEELIQDQIAQDVEALIRGDMPTPDWLTILSELKNGEIEVVAKINGHPNLPDHPEFCHKFIRLV